MLNDWLGWEADALFLKQMETIFICDLVTTHRLCLPHTLCGMLFTSDDGSDGDYSVSTDGTESTNSADI